MQSCQSSLFSRNGSGGVEGEVAEMVGGEVVKLVDTLAWGRSCGLGESEWYSSIGFNIVPCTWGVGADGLLLGPVRVP